MARVLSKQISANQDAKEEVEHPAACASLIYYATSTINSAPKPMSGSYLVIFKPVY
jgi:hypothetical protein